MTKTLGWAGRTLAAALLLGAGQAAAQSLPDQLVWTAYGTNSSGYAQAVAIGNMLKNKHGTALRVLPGRNDVARMTPLKQEKVDFCACGIASYYGQEGIFLFAKADWGPQPIRMLMTSIGGFGLALVVAGDTEAKSYADLKGKRIVFVRGAPALNKGTEAYLAFGGLSWNDVTKVEVSGFAASFTAVLNDQADAAFSSTVSPPVSRLAASPRGVVWPAMGKDDAAAWERMKKVAPYFLPHTVTSGAEISKDKPWSGATYPYPILVANASQKADVVYALVKAMIQNFDDYKDGAPGAAGWALAAQNLSWVMPYHDGAIRAFKEAGVWKAEHQAHNDRLIARQATLAEAWKAFTATKPAEDGFEAAWMKARAEALDKAGFDPVFR
jgi:TRAP transporter TAXI family solute receptor